MLLWPRGALFDSAARLGVALAKGGEEVREVDLEGVAERVPSVERSDGAPLLDLDECASGLAGFLGEIVVGPAALVP